MEKETTKTIYLHLQDDGSYNTLLFNFTITPNVGDYISYIDEQGQTQFLMASKKLFNQVTNNLVITLKNI
jgi:hypothetical protein